MHPFCGNCVGAVRRQSQLPGPWRLYGRHLFGEGQRQALCLLAVIPNSIQLDLLPSVRVSIEVVS